MPSAGFMGGSPCYFLPMTPSVPPGMQIRSSSFLILFYFRMQAGPLDARHRVCVCRKHCNGQPHILPLTTYYRHLADADEDKQTRIRAASMMSLDAAHLVVSNTPNLASTQSNALPAAGLGSSMMSRSAQRMAALQGLAKRAREASDSQRRIGKRRCACNKENVPLEVHCFIYLQNSVKISVLACMTSERQHAFPSSCTTTFPVVFSSLLSRCTRKTK